MIKSKILLQADKCLVMQPELIKIAGKSAALLLQQIHYWIHNENVKGKIHNQKKWIANSYEAWTNDLKIMSRSTVGRSISILKNLGILCVEKLSTFKSNRTNWYTINYNRISEILHPVDLLKKEIHVDTIIPQNHVVESVKMSSSSAQNEPIYIDKKTNKDNLINQIKSGDTLFISTEKEKTLTQKMIDIWNNIINPDIKTELTKNRCRFLVAALKYKFNNDLIKWKEYCHKISTSDYLMGKIKNGFKIALDSCLKFDFIQKIFEKQFGVKHIQPYHEIKKNIYEEIDHTEMPYEIKEIHRKIFKKIGHTKYIFWFKDTKIQKSSTVIQIFVKTTFKKNWIINNYQSDIDHCLGEKTQILVM